MTDARYAALAHILLSDTFSSDGSYALFGCNESFKSWCRQNVIGFGADGHECNPNATGRLICARQGEVPDNFQAFMLHTGAGNQLILSFKFIPYGHIDLQKVSANPGMCEGNPLYSLAGAEYTVYRNSGLTDVAGTITTDGEGYGKLEDLDPGDYWVKETKQALGHALDPTVYKTTVVSDETTRVNGETVSDIAQSDPVGMLLGKIDSQTGEPSLAACVRFRAPGGNQSRFYEFRQGLLALDGLSAHLATRLLLEYGGLHVLGAHARERVVLGAPALNLDSKRSRCCGALGQREAAREVVGGMEQRDRLFVGDALDHAAWQLLECGVGRGKEGVCRFSPVARYHLVGSAFQLAHERQVREPLLSDGFRQPCDGGFVHRVDGVSRVVFDSGQVYLEYGVALARARCIVQKPRYGESLRYVFSRGHGAPPRQERRNHAQGGS